MTWYILHRPIPLFGEKIVNFGLAIANFICQPPISKTHLSYPNPHYQIIATKSKPL